MQIRTARAGKPTGVWELEALQAAVDRGEVLPADLVWTSGFKEWKSLSEVATDIGISVRRSPPPIPGSLPPEIPQPKKEDGHDMASVVFSTPQKKPDSKEPSGCLSLLGLGVIAFMVIGWIYNAANSNAISSLIGRSSAISSPAIENLFKPLSRHIKVQNCHASSTYNVGTDCTVLYTCGTGLSEAFGLNIDMSDFRIAQYRQGTRSSQDLRMIAKVRVDEPTEVHIFGDVDDGADEYRLFMHGEEVKDGSVLFDPSNPFYKSNICPL